jgi:hypothetical protein
MSLVSSHISRGGEDVYELRRGEVRLHFASSSLTATD